MNYFEDITFIHVAEGRSSVDSLDTIVSEYGFGIMTGNGYIRRPGRWKDYLLKMPFLYLVRPGDHSGWKTVGGAERHNRWFVADGPRAERMYLALSEFLKDDGPAIYLDNYQDLIVIHQRMLHLFQCGVPARWYQLARHAEEFIATVYDLLNFKNKDLPIFQYISKIVEQISLHPEMNYDFRCMAKENHVSYDYFRHCFKSYAGQTMRDFLLEKRLAHALGLLRESAESIKEITDRCGFPRQAEFARFIKLRTGLTPSQIRKQSGWFS